MKDEEKRDRETLLPQKLKLIRKRYSFVESVSFILTLSKSIIFLENKNRYLLKLWREASTYEGEFQIVPIK